MAGGFCSGGGCFAGRAKIKVLTCCCLAMLLLGWSAEARQLEVLQLRTYADAKHTRVVLDLNGPASYQVFRQEHSGDMVIQVAGARHARSRDIIIAGRILQSIKRQDIAGGAEVVLVLAKPAKFKYFSLPATDGAAHRIVIDLLPQAGARPTEGKLLPGDGFFTVIIDPGHGGLDSGAVRDGTREKDVVLDIARRMQGLLVRQAGFKAVLTRQKDNYPSLEQRVNIAEQNQGDMLLSVHCNSSSSPAARGTEVYCRSLAGALSRKEEDLAVAGRAAQVLGLSWEQYPDPAVLDILLDVQLGQNMRQSVQLAENILVKAAADPDLRRRRIRQGQYKVLDSLCMPAVLVEVAFMSNPEELELLNERGGRQQIAEVLVEAIVEWKLELEGSRQ